MAGDTKGLFWLVRLFRESLQDNKIQPVSDWGQVVAGSNPVSPTHKQGLNCCDRLTHRSQNTTLGPFRDHGLTEPELPSVRKRTAKPFTRVTGLA